MSGKVYLVGAGPGDPELLTLKAVRVLQAANVVLHDDLVSQEILDLVPSSALVKNVGKRCGRKSVSQEEINFLMITMASAGMAVVRLKSGDPLIFGRGGEELQALRTANIECEVVPGITSALAAAASAQVPLTDRRASSAVVLMTAHEAANKDEADWSLLANSRATLVVYMPGRNYSEMTRKFISAGMGAETPCAIISRASTPHQQVHTTIIQNLALSPRLPAPSLLIVGDVVRLGSSWAEISSGESHALGHDLLARATPAESAGATEGARL
jgi:uroporphyrin-III C-methyltransferase